MSNVKGLLTENRISCCAVEKAHASCRLFTSRVSLRLLTRRAEAATQSRNRITFHLNHIPYCLDIRNDEFISAVCILKTKPTQEDRRSLGPTYPRKSLIRIDIHDCSFARIPPLPQTPDRDTTYDIQAARWIP